MNFKTTKLKTIISITVIVIWYILLSIWINGVTCECIDTNINCPDVFTFSLLIGDDCNCGCPPETTLLDVLGQLIGILFPGLLIYIIWSLFQKKESKVKVRGKKKK